MVEVLRAAVERLISGGVPRVFPEGIALMAVTLVVNVFVVSYEQRAGTATAQRSAAGRRQAHAQRRADVGCRARRAARRLVGISDRWIRSWRCSSPASSATPCWSIAQEASRILSDEIVIAEDEVRAVVQSVPDVIGCEKIRTRGSADHAFLDLHLWLDGAMTLQEAHATSHVVKDKLMTRFPQLVDVVIHIEPPPGQLKREG